MMQGSAPVVFVDALGAAFALIAAALWFASARTNPPTMVTYWDSAPPDDPFVAWVRRSAQLNRYAAFFTGLSALCAVGHFALERLYGQSC